ncbi:hypothetical protein N1028_02065 [Herbiconiux sp. CPCC 203407]|uniref:Uncharacterized protein n=1 Tax=Herbiconiux oxytropis TaxID=2970915 RepID=A0AA41XFC2_9MICO|nr:hypothetical protein [Herbiconiux oxytropis]MCS5721023.1 hypothetical protein [Herbiconiux oxytropis]MCS5724675.1 hypothetical protein [Herbiconiux oxytropis]
MRTHVDVVEIMPVVDAGWRLWDSSMPESDSRGLLGFVEADGAGFHAVWLTPRLASEYFDSLEDAARAARQQCLERGDHA